MDTTKGYQQGDVLLKMRDAMPEGGVPVNPGPRGYVLAEGEHTGHAHAMEATPAVEMFERDGTLWLRVSEPTPLVHEEHHAQTVQPGVYEVGRVVEMDPFADEVRTVAD